MKNAGKRDFGKKRVFAEAKQHTDDEIVDFDEIDLQAEYDRLNEMLFGGSLQPVTMLWNNRKTAHGVVKGQRVRQATLGGGMVTTKLIIKSLQLSKFLDVPYKTFKDTLAHEMIHVKLLQNGIDDGHGPRFLSEMNRINSMGLGFNVSVRLDSGSFAISKSVKGREMVLIILSSDKKDNMVAVTSPSVFQVEGSFIKELYGKLIKSGKYRWVKGEFYKSSNPELQRFTNQRSFRRKFSYQTLDDQQVEKLKADAELIGSFEIDWNSVTAPNVTESNNKKMENKEESNMNPIRQEIRKIIKEIEEESTQGKDKAREALIALSKNEIPKEDLIELNGNLHGADFDEEGYTSSDGEVEVEWMYEGVKYITTFSVIGSFRFSPGSSGVWGASVDVSSPPEPDDYSNEEVSFEDTEVIIYNEDDDEFYFKTEELGREFERDLESFLTDRYDPLSEKIS